MATKRKVGTLAVQGGTADTAVVETGEVPVEAPSSMTGAVMDALKGSRSSPPTLIDVRDGSSVRWYLVDVDGPSVERALAVYRSYRPAPNPMEFITCLGTAAGDMGRTFSLVSRLSL